MCFLLSYIFFFKQKTAYELRISDWSSDVCSSDLSGNVLHGFMVKQTRETDVKLFSDLAEARPFASAKDIPFSILLPAFVTSELKTAFQIGFLIFLPFLIIDLVVASTLMALGMMMLSQIGRASGRARVCQVG